MARWTRSRDGQRAVQGRRAPVSLADALKASLAAATEVPPEGAGRVNIVDLTNIQDRLLREAVAGNCRPAAASSHSAGAGSYHQSVREIEAALAIGIEAEGEDHDDAACITSSQIHWIAAWLASEGIGKLRPPERTES
jgi:hypothetical protein